jgi:hypothetical protein
MRQFVARIVASIDVQTALLAGGLALVSYGSSLIYWPAAFIVPGAVLTAVAIFGVR